MTVNALQPSAVLLGQQRYTQNDLMVDPLIVLRCDRRVYRSGAPALVRGPFTVVQGPFIVKLTHQLDKSWKACDVFKLWVRCFHAYIWFRKNPLLPSSSLLKYFIWNWVWSASMNLNVCVRRQVSPADGHRPPHAERLPAGLKSLLAMSPEGNGWLRPSEPDHFKPGSVWTARCPRGHQGGAKERTSGSSGIFKLPTRTLNTVASPLHSRSCRLKKCVNVSRPRGRLVTCVNICLSPGQRSSPDSARGVSADLRRATARGQQRGPADKRQRPRLSQVKRGSAGTERLQKCRGCSNGGGPTEQSEGGAMSHLLSTASDVHCWSQHCQVGALSGRAVESVWAAAWILAYHAGKNKGMDKNADPNLTTIYFGRVD